MQHGVIQAAQPYGLGLNETLLPQYLKELGYATHAVGKVYLKHLLFYFYDVSLNLRISNLGQQIFKKNVSCTLADCSYIVSGLGLLGSKAYGSSGLYNIKSIKAIHDNET